MSEQLTLQLILLICNSLSLIGSIFIISAYIWLKSIRSFAFKLVFFMSISDIIHSISLLLPPQGLSCQVQGFLLQYSAISSVLWTLNIAFALYVTALKGERDPARYQTRFLILGYIIPLLLALVPLFLDAYNEAAGWCWINSSFSVDLALRLFCFYFIVWTVIPFNLFAYIKVIYKIKQEYGGFIEYQNTNNAMIKRLSLYPIVLIVCYLPITIKRTLEIGGGDLIPFWFTCVSAFGISITGFVNSIVYGLSGPVKDEIKAVCFKGDRAASAFSLYTQKFSEAFITNNL